MITDLKSFESFVSHEIQICRARSAMHFGWMWAFKCWLSVSWALATRMQNQEGLSGCGTFKDGPLFFWGGWGSAIFWGMIFFLLCQTFSLGNTLCNNFFDIYTIRILGYKKALSWFFSPSLSLHDFIFGSVCCAAISFFGRQVNQVLLYVV